MELLSRRRRDVLPVVNLTRANVNLQPRLVQLPLMIRSPGLLIIRSPNVKSVMKMLTPTLAQMENNEILIE